MVSGHGTLQDTDCTWCLGLCPVLLLSQPESHAGVEDEPWYHGEISRQEASGLLKKLGDFLVRYSAEKEHYTLSVKMDSIRHFIIQHNDEVG